jgi:hypothetical protein
MTKQEFEFMQNELESSGQTLKEFMAFKGLAIHRYYYWKKKYSDEFQQSSGQNFIQLAADNDNNSGVRLEYPNGVVLNLRVHPGNKSLLELINPML